MPSQENTSIQSFDTVKPNTNFLYSFLILPKHKRKAIETIYALCRVVDDIVDESSDAYKAQIKLDDWRKEIDNCFSNKPPKTQLGKDLQATIQNFPIPQSYFEDLIIGMEMDLKKTRYSNFSELEKYCYHVAGIVGLMCIEIFGYTHTSAKKYAIKLGTALQIINIMRDVKEDAERSRVYFPQDELEQFRYSENQLLNGIYNDNFVALMKCQDNRVRSFFAQAQAELHPDDRSQMLSAEIMGKIYFKILKHIEKANYDVFSKRLSLSKYEKALIAIFTWVQTKF